jgi:hypothetical protein
MLRSLIQAVKSELWPKPVDDFGALVDSKLLGDVRTGFLALEEVKEMGPWLGLPVERWPKHLQARYWDAVMFAADHDNAAFDAAKAASAVTPVRDRKGRFVKRAPP